MKMRGSLAVSLALLSVCLAPAVCHAQNAPAQLRGKSVVASWTEERLQRLGGMGEFTQRGVAQQLSAYISNEGRVFARRAAWSSGGGKKGPGNISSVGASTAGATGNQRAQISGRTLMVTNNFRGGARMARIEFSPDFSSCTANVILGRENGAGIARGRSSISGAALEIKEAHVTNPSCSVREGNVFGQ